MTFFTFAIWQHVVYAQYLYYFAKHITFPQNKDNHNYRIGVMGSSDMLRETRHMSLSKVVNGRTIDVRPVKDMSEAADMHLLFVGRDNKADLSAIINYCKVHNILLVTEMPHTFEKGATIQFFEDDSGNIKFKINTSTCGESHLRVHKTLLGMAYHD